MAVLTGPTILATGGSTSGGPRWAVLGFQNVTTADTFDCASLTAIAPFVTVTHAFTAPMSNRTATAAVGTIATNTNVSLLGTGVARDAVVLFVMGE
jgi:hypothetical protein